MVVMDRDWIKEHVPHREPFLLLDRVIEIVPGERIIAERDVSIDEPWFAGHFPGTPVFPGVLIAEVFAQAAAIVFATAFPSEKGLPVYLTGLDNIRFRRMVKPGETMRVECVKTGSKRKLWTFDGKITVNGERCFEGSMLATGQGAIEPKG